MLTKRFAMYVGEEVGGGTVVRELAEERPVAIPYEGEFLTGSVAVPVFPAAVVVIADDRGCSRQTASKRALARALREAGLATVMVDLLTPDEQASWAAPRLRQDAVLLARRIEAACQWVSLRPNLAWLPIALLGEDGAAAAVLQACAARPHDYVSAVACGPGPYPMGIALELIETPVLLVPTGARAELALESSDFILRQLRNRRSDQARSARREMRCAGNAYSARHGAGFARTRARRGLDVPGK
jgi:putative phosphoribosyl transferase